MSPALNTLDRSWSSVPDPADAEAILRQEINDLAASGALDEGSGHVFDARIDTWVSSWRDMAEAAHDARENLYDRRIAEQAAGLARAQAKREAARNAVLAADAELRAIHDWRPR